MITGDQSATAYAVGKQLGLGRNGPLEILDSTQLANIDPAVLKALSESLRLEYAQFLELEVFTRFGTMVDERTRKLIEHGRRIRAVLAQAQYAPLSLGEQVALLTAVAEGVLDELPLDRIDAFRAGLGAWLARDCPGALVLDAGMAALPEALAGPLKAALRSLAQSLKQAAKDAGPTP